MHWIGRLSAIVLALVSLIGVQARAARAQSCAVPALFGTALQPVVNGAQRYATAADLNEDGAADLIVSVGNLAVILGIPGAEPAPQFLGPVYYPTASDPTGVAVADFDRDGALDIAVACDGGSVSILQGQLSATGDPTGTMAVRSPLFMGSCWDVETADINRDGWDDLIVALRGGSVQVMFGAPPAGGSIVFGSGPSSPAGGSPKGIELAYVDDDQILDVIVSQEGPSIGVLRGVGSGNVGDGTFEAPRNFPADGTTFDVAIADLDRNGRPDIVSANYGGSSVSVYRNLGGFAFESVHYDALGSPLGVAVGDVDLDGIDDIVASAAGSGYTFSVLLGGGSNDTWNETFESAIGVGQRSAYGITLTDVDDNGSLDVIAPIFTVSLLDLFVNTCVPGGPITLTVNALGGGTVTKSPDLEIYPEGTVVTLTAVPNAHHSFLNWGGALTGSANPETITMSRARFVTATFAIDQFAVTISTAGPGAGAIMRTPSLPMYAYGSTVRLTALPEPESAFDSWSGDATGNANPLDVFVDGPKSIIGTFVADTLIPPGILSVVDVPLDQGGSVKIRWRASSWDGVPGEPLAFVRKYLVWREVPPTVALAAATAQSSATRFHRTTAAGQEYYWEYVTTLPASAFPGYSYTAATTSDSTTDGNPYTRFMIQGRNADDTRWWDSAPDSGYSVDNLAPPTPLPFTGTFGPTNALHWTPSRSPDFREFRLYRGANSDFVPGPDNFLVATRDTGYVDTEGGSRAYKLVAVDVHGNVSRVATVSSDLPVATLASVASVETRPDRIVIRWHAGGHAGVDAIVYRRTETRDWGEVASLSFDGQGMLRYEDHDVVTGVRYGYVLGISDGGEIVRAGEAWATAEAPPLAFLGAWPNPAAAGEMRVRFSLPGSGPARIHLLDIAGRRIHSREVGTLGAGSHEVGIGEGFPLPAGIYVLRFETGELVRTQRIAVLN